MYRNAHKYQVEHDNIITCIYINYNILIPVNCVDCLLFICTLST